MLWNRTQLELIAIANANRPSTKITLKFNGFYWITATYPNSYIANLRISVMNIISTIPFLLLNI